MRLSLRVCFVCVTIILCVCVCFCVFFRRLCANLALCWMFRSGSVEGFVSETAGGYFRRTARFVSLFLFLSPSLSFCYYIKFYSDSRPNTTILILILSRRVTRRFRIANHVVMDSCCRGGIVHIRGGCSRALFVPPRVPRRFGGFAQVLQTVQVAVLGRTLDTQMSLYLSNLRSTRYSSMWR